MNTWRGEYSVFEWAQIAVFLVGTPLAALLGALIGLFGKWNQGRVVTAALVGLAAAAFVSGALLLTFVFVNWQLEPEKRGLMEELFDSFFGQRIAIVAAIATGAISLLAGVGLRSHKNERGHATSISMRQMLLAQLFVFITLGCWTGMRLFALESGSELDRVHRLWRSREWAVQGSEFGKPSYLVRQFPAQRIDMQKEAEYLREGLRTPWIRQLRLSEIPSLDELPISELAKELAEAKQLEMVMLSLAGAADFRQREIDALGKAPSLRRIYLQTSGKLDAELLPLAALPRLQRLSLRDCTVTPAAFSALASSDSLRVLHLERAGAASSQPIEWPSQLEELSIRQANPQRRWNLERLDAAASLQSLSVYWQTLQTKEVQAISRIGGLQTLTLDSACSEQDAEHLLALRELRELNFYTGVRVSEPFKQTMERFALLPTMERLHCGHEILIEAKEGNEEPMPSLEEMLLRQKSYTDRMNAQRQELGLGPIAIRFTKIGWAARGKAAAGGSGLSKASGASDD